MAFLRASAASYDAGFYGEAKRLATVARILLHDTPRSRSLLESLRIKHVLRFYDRYADRKGESANVYVGVGMTFTPKGLRYIANLTEPKVQSAFEDWWNGIAIRRGDTIYRRKDVLLGVSDMDGGAHVDPGLEVRYAELSREYTSLWTVHVGDSIGTVENGPELPIVRQCAFELEMTLVRQTPDLLRISLDEEA